MAIGTNISEPAATSDMDKLLTLMSVVNDPERVNKALNDLKQAKAEADQSLYDLELGKAAAVALSEAHALKADLEKRIDETDAAVAGLIRTARSQASRIKGEAESLANRTSDAAALVAEKLANAEKEFSAAKEAKSRADESRLTADEALAAANETQARLNNRLAEINVKIAAL